MSRFDQPAENDPNAYDEKPHDPQDDLDVPDFDAIDIGNLNAVNPSITLTSVIDPPEGIDGVIAYAQAVNDALESGAYDPPDSRSEHEKNYQASVLAEMVAAAIDPAEHAAHALIDALTTLEQQIALCSDLERINQLRQMVRRHWQHATAVCDRAAAKVDEILEMRR